MEIKRLSADTLARAAFRKAIELRTTCGKDTYQSICPIDIAIQTGIETRYASIPSLEGVYLADPPSILMSSLRPTGRQSFTCAHELGHHAFGHGNQMDEIRDMRDAQPRFNPNEFLADAFAGFLLMPPTAVDRMLAMRNITLSTAVAEDLYAICCQLGVGYSTLLTHLRWGLRRMDDGTYRAFKKLNLKEVRKRIAGVYVPGHLIPVDENWIDRPVDMTVGDHLFVDFPVYTDSPHLEVKRTATAYLIEAKSKGVAYLETHTNIWASTVRITSPNYAGLAKYRHLEDVTDE